MTTSAQGEPVRRIASLDVMRGLVCVLMAIDHVRVYASVPAGGLPPSVFFTRWVTHFVAPAFCFLAGTGVFLHGRKLGDRAALAKFLVSRGLVLVLLEMTVIRFAWTFNFDYAHYMLAGVIWMLGWCMVLLAGIIYLPMRGIATLAIVTIVAHPVLQPLMNAVHAPEGSFLDAFFKILYLGGGFSLYGADGPPLIVLFVIIPWVGVMAAGYAFGPVMGWTPERRRAFCLQLGIGAMVLFVALRALDSFGDPRHWHDQVSEGWPLLLAFLNTSKYPASFLFLLMTLGPTIALLPLAESAHGWFARMLETFGRVPMFYYLLHIPMIHLAAMVVSVARTGSVIPQLVGNFPVLEPHMPDGYRWPLVLLYVVWAVCLSLLYPVCRWYGSIKARRRSRWFSFI